MSNCKSTIKCSYFDKEVIVDSSDTRNAEDSDGLLSDTETLIISTKQFPYICRLCLRSDENKLRELKDYLHLTDVIRNITNIEVKRFDGYPQNICEVCILQLENILEFIDNTRNCNESLQRIQESLDGNRHLCEECPKSFAHIGALKRHQERHKEVQKFNCPICHRGFGRRTHLTHHLSTHTADKPFYCTICSRGFATEITFERHNRRHTANKQFHCEVCPKKFINMQELRQHTRYHTGQRPFSCKPCNKHFRQRAHLQLHLNTQHKTEEMITGYVAPEVIVIEKEEIDDVTQIQVMGPEDVKKEDMHETSRIKQERLQEESFNEGGSTSVPVCVICSKKFEVCYIEDS